jgi:predicted dinucleotide-binding enzyme
MLEELWEKHLPQMDTIFGVPNPEDEKNKKLIDTIGPNNASVGSVADAVHFAELVVLATPWKAGFECI